MAGDGERAKIVREKLLLDSEAAFRETVEKASRLLKLDESGKVHSVMDPSKLGAKQKIELYLLGIYLGHSGKLTEKGTASDEEIAIHFGLKVSEVQKRLHDLKKTGKVAPGDNGEYRLTEARLPELLRDLGCE
jgi:hypothetical protein